MKRKLLILPVLALASLLALNSVAGSPRTSAATPATWNITVGQGGQGIAANDFFPDVVTIGQGDTIHFDNPYLEIHTVTFLPAGMSAPDFVVPGPSGPPQFILNPQAVNPTATGTATFNVNTYYTSGLLQKGGTADVTFPNQGTFTFLCLVHGPSMSLTVTVGAPGAAPQTQTQIDAAGKAQSDQLIANGVSAASQIKSTKQQLADGSYNWSVQAGGSVNEADLVQYNSPNITINAGDTVTWTNPTATPHTVTFIDPGQSLPSAIAPLPQPSGPPLLELTSQTVLPAGGATYAGSGFTSSGIFATVGAPTNKYSLKFTKPGTYTYHCILHDDQGMMGTITVVGATAPAAGPTPTGKGGGTAPAGVLAPNTGSGPAASGSGGWLPGLLLLGFAGAALLLAGARLARTRAD